jgi:hypothetical protein
MRDFCQSPNCGFALSPYNIPGLLSVSILCGWDHVSTLHYFNVFDISAACSSVVPSGTRVKSV